MVIEVYILKCGSDTDLYHIESVLMEEQVSGSNNLSVAVSTYGLEKLAC
jgi:hypothetical protein